MSLLTVKEAAEKLGVSPPRIYQLIHGGQLKAAKFGNAWTIDPKDLAKLKRLPRGRPPVPNPVRPRPRKGDQQK